MRAVICFADRVFQTRDQIGKFQFAVVFRVTADARFYVVIEHRRNDERHGFHVRARFTGKRDRIGVVYVKDFRRRVGQRRAVFRDRNVIFAAEVLRPFIDHLFRGLRAVVLHVHARDRIDVGNDDEKSNGGRARINGLIIIVTRSFGVYVELFAWMVVCGKLAQCGKFVRRQFLSRAVRITKKNAFCVDGFVCAAYIHGVGLRCVRAAYDVTARAEQHTDFLQRGKERSLRNGKSVFRKRKVGIADGKVALFNFDFVFRTVRGRAVKVVGRSAFLHFGQNDRNAESAGLREGETAVFAFLRICGTHRAGLVCRIAEHGNGIARNRVSKAEFCVVGKVRDFHARAVCNRLGIGEIHAEHGFRQTFAVGYDVFVDDRAGIIVCSDRRTFVFIHFEFKRVRRSVGITRPIRMILQSATVAFGARREVEHLPVVCKGQLGRNRCSVARNRRYDGIFCRLRRAAVIFYGKGIDQIG